MVMQEVSQFPEFWEPDLAEAFAEEVGFQKLDSMSSTSTLFLRKSSSSDGMKRSNSLPSINMENGLYSLPWLRRWVLSSQSIDQIDHPTVQESPKNSLDSENKPEEEVVVSHDISHRLHTTHLFIPVACAYCGLFIWGLSKNAVGCHGSLFQLISKALFTLN